MYADCPGSAGPHVFPDSQTIWLPARTAASGMQGLGGPGERAGPRVLQHWGPSMPRNPHIPSRTAIPGDARALGKVSSAPVVYLIGGKEYVKAPLISPQLSLFLLGCVLA